MANYKKRKVEVKIPFTYKGTHYKSIFEGNKKQIEALKQYLK
jgi:hypothetical protein